MTKKEYQEDLTAIIKLESEITQAISEGHKASQDDQFNEHRKKLMELRKKLGIPNHVQQKYTKGLTEQ